MIELIRGVIRQEMSTFLTSILYIVLFVFISQRTISYVTELITENDNRHKDLSVRMNNLYHEQYHLREKVDEIEEDLEELEEDVEDMLYAKEHTKEDEEEEDDEDKSSHVTV